MPQSVACSLVDKTTRLNLKLKRPHSLALFTAYDNFVRTHKTLRTTPAMAAGVSTRPWEIELRRLSRSLRSAVPTKSSRLRDFGREIYVALSPRTEPE